MCNTCRDAVIDFIENNIRSKFQTAKGETFTLDGYVGDSVQITTSKGWPRFFHLQHLIECYHWMAFLGGSIHGVGSHRESVRGLVGSGGQLAKCELCDRNPAYIWGLLRAMKNVRLDQGNILSFC